MILSASEIMVHSSGFPRFIGPVISSLSPTKRVSASTKSITKQKTLKNNIRKVVGVWEKNPDGSYHTPEHDVHTVNEWIEILPVEKNPLRNFIKGVLRESL